MACGCGGAKKNTYIVTLPGGSSFEVPSEAQARIEVTKAGGGSYKVKA